MDILGSPYPFVYTSTGSAASGTCSFSIPAGTYTSGVLGLNSVNGSPPSFTEDVNVQFTGQATPTYIFHFFTSGAGESVAHTLTTAELALINAAAGGSITLTMTGLTPFPSNGVTSPVNADLTLYGSGGGVTVTSFGCSASAPDSNGSSLITITLKDNSGNPAPAPLGGQAFTLTTSGGSISPASVVIAQGASVGMAMATNTAPGTTSITIVAGAGPVSGQANCVAMFTVSNTVASANTPDLCLLKVTRPNIRDSLRIMIGITPPIQVIPGALPGEEPAGESYPGNMVLNQAIADAIRDINRECDFHSSFALTLNVPATTSAGPQFFPLAGIGAGPYQNIINQVKRAVWDDGSGNLTRLLPRSLWDMDRQRRAFDMETPATPSEFVIEANSIGLLPGSSAGGTVRMYAGTGLLGFCSDVDTLDELPIDYQAVVEYWAVVHVCMNQADDPKYQSLLKAYLPLAKAGIPQILRMLKNINGEEQSTLVYRSARRNRWR